MTKAATIGLFAGLLLALAATTGGFGGLILALILGAVGLIVGLQVDGTIDVRAIARGRSRG
ncbi:MULTISPECIES: hypothetical protein [Gordonia]|uniref:DUF2273 domain-containing protein n=2 Tax=Gordonia TaxID=2053 RepID=L7LLD2_9ACTN|nr:MULTISPECIES: hypothetical protein [Gordonia]AUH67589.1 DUF2273 domain-containing protein [Gordonia sp. YC-JH1]KJR07245.1 hypothetical protein UG54_11340 [Gordonia sihwensis]KXT57200.1 hypothetical protein Y710_08805 [Gordonia sp. QH-12]MBY4568692.1 DUF2273 domain-containing protein [Gordonia sihwensis]WFN92746.1 DUF2273 domain-containing protein [Gordonia sihwensis]